MGPTVPVEVEDDTLALAQHAEDGPLEGVGGQVVLASVGVPDHDPVPGPRVVGLDDPLQRSPYSRLVDPSSRGELAAIERIRMLLPRPADGDTWIGDDAAVVGGPEGRLLLTTDAVVAGVHADLSLVGLDDLGWKAVAVSVSDIAAMGGLPRYALVTLCAPPETDLDLLYLGVARAAEASACPVVGGDLSGARELAVTVAVAGDSGQALPVMRSGARAGEAVFVTGPLGSSAAGLRLLRAGQADPADPLVRAHRRPWARLAEGQAARAAGATAMIDVSDGLGTDLRHLAGASGVGMELDTVPVADGASWEEAVGGGEDYELVFTVPDPAGARAAFAAAGLGPPVHIGHCTPDQGQLLVGGDPLPAAGWEHQWQR